VGCDLYGATILSTTKQTHNLFTPEHVDNFRERVVKRTRKPVGELPRTLPSCKRLLLSDGEASNDTLSNRANFTPQMQASLFYAARGGNCGRHEKCRILVALLSRQMLLLQNS